MAQQSHAALLTTFPDLIGLHNDQIDIYKRESNDESPMTTLHEDFTSKLKEIE